MNGKATPETGAQEAGAAGWADLAPAEASADAAPVHALDLRGLKCPLPVLRIRKAVRRLPKGSRIVAEATDPLASVDIPNYCREAGLKLVDSRREGDVLVFRIQL